jgi:hypothetical protein
MQKKVKYEGCLKSSWTGGSAPLLCREKTVTVMSSCSGGDNVVVAWSSFF